MHKSVAEFKELSQVPIQPITSGKLAFNCFVRSLHEAIQDLRELKQIIRLSSGAMNTARANIHKTFVHQHGRNPKSLKRKPIKNFYSKHSHKNHLAASMKHFAQRKNSNSRKDFR